jgi:two-component system chemotaxis response regulator CheB
VTAAAVTAIRVVVIEDASQQRSGLVEALESAGDLVVAGRANAVEQALATVQEARPDVVVVSMDMDGGGRSVIERIMSTGPVPILVVSAQAQQRDSTAAIEALVAGAADVLPTPAAWTPADADALRRRIRVLRGVSVVTRRDTARVRPPQITVRGRGKIIAIGASTGGPVALVAVLAGLGGIDAPILCVQHIHRNFVEGFANWLSRRCGVPVDLATDAMRPVAGRVYLAPADCHMRLGADLALELSTEPETINRPSIDELFISVAEHAGASACAALLTGMCEDGARGLLAIREAGGYTVAQDEATSVVFGMPAAASRLGAAETVAALDDNAGALRSSLQRATA